MHRGERFIVYGGLTLALAAALGNGGAWLPEATAARRAADEPPVARVAICDSYKITDKMIESDRYAPEVDAERVKLRSQIEPLEQELTALGERVRAASPDDPASQELAQSYQRKRQEYLQANQRLQEEFQSYLARTYVKAYEEVRTSVDAVAEDLGYTHVIASRGEDEKIETDSIQRVIEAVLARPILRTPEGSDITEDVMQDLKLE